MCQNLEFNRCWEVSALNAVNPNPGPRAFGLGCDQPLTVQPLTVPGDFSRSGRPEVQPQHAEARHRRITQCRVGKALGKALRPAELSERDFALDTDLKPLLLAQYYNNCPSLFLGFDDSARKRMKEEK
ncbi:hypothetical protein P7K49_016254 [Saguinus oedipus]|uniref:Uncharacterized protein n=1 Tax=Saguinus oedipus TaxID=9490 RepID=A0ABQ9VCC8_SAGOE|nr:hypothetical protein P7K49_016254 [Saguinus oedipus]